MRIVHGPTRGMSHDFRILTPYFGIFTPVRSTIEWIHPQSMDNGAAGRRSALVLAVRF